MEHGRAAPPGRRSTLAARVVGRDPELGALRAALAAARERQGRVSFLVGEAGIGKSRLARLTAAHAERSGMAVLTGRAVRTATPVAYRPLAEALYSIVRVGGVPDAPALAHFRATLGRLIPEWHVGGEARVDDSVVALAEAVLRFLRAAAGDRGCLVVLEDLHWADPETLTILEYLADNLASERVLCVGTVRTEERPPALDLARALRARRATELIELSSLDDADVAEMVRSCLDAVRVPEPILRLAARAEGVPFLVEELLAVAVASGTLVDEGHAWVVSSWAEPVVPLTFADSVRRRLATLGHEVRAVLVAAAVLGRRFEWDLLPAITGLDERAVLGALHAAVDTQIVAVEANGAAFRFRHALSRDAVLAELLPPERGALSRRALEAIEVAHPDLPGAWWELAAELAEGAGDRRRAAVLLLGLGRRAFQAGALASAEAALQRACLVAPGDDPVIADVEECLVDVLSLAGKRDEAVEVGESLLVRLEDEPDAARRRAETHLRLARAALAATRWEEALTRLEDARAQATQVADARLDARVDALDALTALGDDDLERAADLARVALATAERADLPEVACEALEVLGRCRRPYDLDAAEGAFQRAHTIAREHGLPVWRVRALHELGTIDLLSNRPIARLEEARELAASQGALATAAVLDVQIAAALMLQDDPELAMPIARRGAELARRYGLNETLAASLGFEATVHARARRRSKMEDCLRQARAHAEGRSDVSVIETHARVLLAFGEEDRSEALRRLEEVVGIGFTSTGPLPGWWALLRAVDGNDGDAAVVKAAARGDPVHFLARAYLRYAEAVVAGRAGHKHTAVALVLAGDRLLEGRGWFLNHGRRLVAEAAVADGWGAPVAWLYEALAFFEECDHGPIASACRSLLRQAGAPVPRRRSGTDAVPTSLRALGVTSRELEVLTLLAEGLANREIGARLYLSPRTVERHVANLVAKAGVERRSQLVAFAARAAADTSSS
ncbi:MAG: AAA family ATPase [Actinobacteria bacterium]|nr:AAA family ATPase [Actinomycetota bacterium]